MSHLRGQSFRSLAEEHDFSASTAFRHYRRALKQIPYCSDLTRFYCSKFCGILVVDGKYIAVKGYEKKIPVLYGIDYLTHDIPAYILSIGENFQTCRSFFNSLRLLNYPLQAVVSDDNINIYQACTSVYPQAITQICQNHYKEGIRKILGVRTDETHVPFMEEIEGMFKRRCNEFEFNHYAQKVYLKHQSNEIYKDILLDIQKRLPMLLAYNRLPNVPRTTNLIESFNSHLEGRLKTIKGFKSFTNADNWLNGYFVRRRLKKFTDCTKKFKNLNGKCSLELTIKENYKIDDVLKLLR